MKSLVFGIGASLVAPLVFSVSAMAFGESEKTVKEHWVRSKLEGVAAGAWPSSPVQLRDGRIFFNDGDIEQITSDTTSKTVNYDQSSCVPVNTAYGLEGTPDNQLIVPFSPMDTQSPKPYPVLGMVNPDTGACRVLAKSPPYTQFQTSLTSDKQGNYYYVVSTLEEDGFQFFKYSEKSGSKKLFSYVGNNIPVDIAVDSKGNLYTSWYSKIEAQYHNQVTVWNAQTGKMSVYAGNGKRGKSPDGTLAVESALGNTYGIAIDAQDNLYIAQEGDATIISRVEAKNGKIYLFAGDGSSWYFLSTNLTLRTGMNPRGISITPDGNILYTDIRGYLALFSDIRMIDMHSNPENQHPEL